MNSSTAHKLGDILSSSWGYDQTNVTFYQVVGITKSSVRIRKIATTIASSTDHTCKLSALPGQFLGTEIVLKRVRRTDRGYAVTINDYADAHLWDGTPQYATPANMGH